MEILQQSAAFIAQSTTLIVIGLGLAGLAGLAAAGGKGPTNKLKVKK